MAKVTLNDPATLDNSILTLITANNTAIETAMEKTLSRDGTSPNTMSADLDMNGNQILNLPEAVDPTDPVRLGELEDMLDGLTGALPTGGTNGQVLAKASDTTGDVEWITASGLGTVTSVAQTVPTGFAVAGSPVTNSGTLAITYDTGYQGYTTAEATKLSGIEALADVTDTANVTAAGALMDSEVTNLAAVKAFDPTDYATAGHNHTGVYQPLDTDLTSWAGVTRASGFDTFVATPSSANLKSLVTDETGSGGALVFATAPALTSPTIATGITPASNDGAALGAGSTAFSDLFLASGAVINFANSDAVITHSTGVINVSTGTLQQGGSPVVTKAMSPGGVTVNIDGGGSAITTGTKGYVTIPYGMTITSWTLLADVSGSIVIDVWKDTYANYPPTVADTITASAKPTLSSATKNTSSTLTGWTTTITAGDVLAFNVDSATTVTKVTLLIQGTRT